MIEMSPYREKKAQSKSIYKKPRFFNAEKTKNRLAKLKEDGMFILPFQEESVEWLQSGRIKMFSTNEEIIDLRSELILALPEESHGTLVVIQKGAVDDWGAICESLRPELDISILKKGTFRFPKKKEVLFLLWSNLPSLEDIPKKTRNFHMITEDLDMVKNHKTQRAEKHYNLVKKAESHFSLVDADSFKKVPTFFGVLRNSGALRLFDEDFDIDSFEERFFQKSGRNKNLTVDLKEFLFSFFRSRTIRNISERSKFFAPTNIFIDIKQEDIKDMTKDNLVEKTALLKIKDVSSFVNDLVKEDVEVLLITSFDSVKEFLFKLGLNEKIHIVSPTDMTNCTLSMNESLTIIQNEPILDHEIRDYVEYKISSYAKRICRKGLKPVEWVRVLSNLQEERDIWQYFDKEIPEIS